MQPASFTALSMIAVLSCRAGEPASPRDPAGLNDGVGLHDHGYEVDLVDRTGDVTNHPQLVAWLRRSVRAVSETTGGASWPIRVIVDGGERIGGRTNDGVITLTLPPGARPPAGSEWVLHHELVHASYPALPEEDRWLEEGLATYLEPLVRARAGQVSARAIWHDIARDLPQGAPREGEGGLRATRAWHRLYWEGAVFWLGSAVAIARRTHGLRSLHDALCAWAKAAGAPGAWTPERAFSIMDEAIGEPILGPRFARASERGLADDPAELLGALGVGYRDDVVTFDERAPEAALRRRLTQPDPRPCRRP